MSNSGSRLYFWLFCLYKIKTDSNQTGNEGGMGRGHDVEQMDPSQDLNPGCTVSQDGHRVGLQSVTPASPWKVCQTCTVLSIPLFLGPFKSTVYKLHILMIMQSCTTKDRLVSLPRVSNPLLGRFSFNSLDLCYLTPQSEVNEKLTDFH